MELGSVLEAVAEIRAAYDQLAELPVDDLTPPELLDALGELETLTRQLPAQSHRVLARLRSRARRPPACWRKLANSARRTALSGQAQAPLLAKTAAAQAAGAIGAEHVAILRGFFTKLPGWVDPAATREQSEATLVEVAAGFGPDELGKAAALLAVLIDQDGPEPDDAERARRRTLEVGRQQGDGMATVSGQVDPQWLATWEPILAKLAAPGMGNPEDCAPRVSGTPSQAQIDGDTRSYGQRVHDAFLAIGRHVLSSGELGQHHGLPATIIVSTTLQDLQAAAGSAVTAGGSVLPMSEVIRLASHAVHYLVVCDEHTSEVLHCGRAKRIAPPHTGSCCSRVIAAASIPSRLLDMEP
ncbi:MAG: hypothetical protein JWR13_5876 [Mycobacterium sp.]|jgi:hypothetical protein|nr:hypothetical protein [Mycobacterium sp.]MDT5312895.1 hypothetical protein [Mycobacterium sp.]